MSWMDVVRRNKRSMAYLLMVASLPLMASTTIAAFAVRHESLVRELGWFQWSRGVCGLLPDDGLRHYANDVQESGGFNDGANSQFDREERLRDYWQPSRSWKARGYCGMRRNVPAGDALHHVRAASSMRT